MRVLLIYPLFPQSFWSFEKTLALVGRKALLPPLGLNYSGSYFAPNLGIQTCRS